MVLFAADICIHFKTNIAGEKRRLKLLNKLIGESEDNFLESVSLKATLFELTKTMLLLFSFKLALRYFNKSSKFSKKLITKGYFSN